MADKVIYVRQADEWLWTWAANYARRTRRSLSAVVLMALESLHDEVEQGKENPRQDDDA